MLGFHQISPPHHLTTHLSIGTYSREFRTLLASSPWKLKVDNIYRMSSFHTSHSLILFLYFLFFRFDRLCRTGHLHSFIRYFSTRAISVITKYCKPTFIYHVRNKMHVCFVVSMQCPYDLKESKQFDFSLKTKTK